MGVGTITFGSVIDAVEKDLNAATIAKLTTEDMIRFCKDAWHECFHSYPQLLSVMDPTTGVIAYASETAPEPSDVTTAFPEQLNARRISIESYVRRRVDMRSQLDRDQIARVTLDNKEFAEEQGIPA